MKNKTKKEISHNSGERNPSTEKIPPVAELTKDEILEIYKEEIKKKDKIIDELQNENKLLLDLTMKNAKRKLEELETSISEIDKSNKFI